MKNIRKSFNQSGGVGYQIRAIWNRKRWRPFCDFISHCLQEWVQSVESVLNSPRGGLQIVLIGPNGGYTLPKNLIQRFRQVVVVDPDPLAYLIFESRFMVNAKWDKTDYFDLASRKPNPQKLKELFKKYENSIFLFCNIIGQILVLIREQNKSVDPNMNRKTEEYMERLASVLESLRAEYKIASYHDRYSRDLKKPNELVDHLTGNLFKQVKVRREFPWQITARLEHQIEFIAWDGLSLVP